MYKGVPTFCTFMPINGQYTCRAIWKLDYSPTCRLCCWEAMPAYRGRARIVKLKCCVSEKCGCCDSSNASFSVVEKTNMAAARKLTQRKKPNTRPTQHKRRATPDARCAPMMSPTDARSRTYKCKNNCITN